MKKTYIILSLFFVTFSYADEFGCMNPNACNYDPDATVDDGSCEEAPGLLDDIVTLVNDGENNVLIYWSFPCGLGDIATYFILGNINGENINMSIIPPYLIHNLSWGTTYNLIIKTVMLYGESFTPLQFVIDESPIPGQIQGLVADSGEASISLSWNAEDHSSTYRIYSNGEVVANSFNGDTYAVLENLHANIDFAFQVSGLNSEGIEGQTSESLTIQVLPIPPVYEILSNSAFGEVGFGWGTPFAYAGNSNYKFNIYDESDEMIEGDYDGNSYIISNLQVNEERCIKITALHQFGESGYSDISCEIAADCTGVIDDCGNCAGDCAVYGEDGLISCSPLTANPYNLIIADDCGICGGDSYASVCEGTDDCENMDCSGVCGGGAVVDVCGICDGGENNSFNCDTIIRIPEDYPTIQAGIDASVDGDTILVADGNYVENLVLNKSIVLTSYAIYDNLDEWIIFDEYYFSRWVINNSHIENTRLIGFSPDDPDYGSVILITPDSEECISPEIVGFTIQGGSGTTILRQEVVVDQEATGTELEMIIINIPSVLGGGILADVSDPHIHHNAFVNNGSEEVYSGGAVQLTSSAEDWSFDNRIDDYDIECEGFEEFRLSNNLYDGNNAQYGNSMANRFYEDDFDMSGSIFDVYDCGNEESAVSSIWVKVEPAASVDYGDSEGQACAITAPHVYVDSNIPQECLDEGCGFLNNPFKTIGRALELINPTEDNPITIHLAAGTYSSETGENFPINMLSNLNIEGEDEEATILDAMQAGRVITMEYCDNNTISGITITGGLAEGQYPNDSGAGMYLKSSNPILNNMTIINNTAQNNGGGIHLFESNPTLTHLTMRNNTAGYGGGMDLFNSNPTLTYVTILNNIVYNYGGGMRLLLSNLTLDNVTISGNTANNYGGGMWVIGSNPTLNHVTISNNTAGYGGGMELFNSNPTLTHVTITGNMADYSGGGMYLNNSTPTLTNSILWDNSPESIDLYQEIPIIIYSDIGGGFEGVGNINTDPLFTDPGNGDYTLQEGSPCIDTGIAIEGIEFLGSAPDMGAYEFGESSEIIAGDTNFDGIVDILDIVRIVNQIMGNSEFNDDEFTAADFNADGIVDILDIVQIVNFILSN